MTELKYLLYDTTDQTVSITNGKLRTYYDITIEGALATYLEDTSDLIDAIEPTWECRLPSAFAMGATS